MYHCSFPLLFLCRLIFLLDSLHGVKLMETYNTTDKDLPQDIHILNLRTLIRVSIITILFLKVSIFIFRIARNLLLHLVRLSLCCTDKGLQLAIHHGA